MDTMVIGIAGGTGSGKTTLTEKLKERFGPDVSVLYHDNYYKKHTGMTYEERSKLNYDHPDAFDSDLFIRDLKALKDAGAEAVVGMSCGDGVQTVADNVQLPVYPANNTMFLGQVERVGMFNEYCKMCGDCVLGSTGGVCPVTRCAKSLVNGPCGGQKNGKCEVNPENECAWILIYKRLEATGQLDNPAQLSLELYKASASMSLLVNLRQKALDHDGRVLDAQARVSYRACRKLFLSENRDLDQTVEMLNSRVGLYLNEQM